MPVIEYDYDDSMIRAEIEGHELKAKSVSELEKSLALDQSDLITRLKLIGYYLFRAWKTAKAAEKYAFHVSWIIDNHPEDPMHQLILAPIRSRPAKAEIRSHWLRQVQRNPKNVIVLDHAAHACSFIAEDKKTAEKLWKRAMRLDPINEDFPRQLSFIYQLQTNDGSILLRKTNGQKAVKYFLKALTIHQDYPCESYLDRYLEKTVLALANRTLALNLVSETRTLANVLLNIKPRMASTTTPRGVRRWKMYTEAKYNGHMLLGKAAILLSDFEAATESLSRMCRCRIPNRPDLGLAQDLLNHGHIKGVIRYLETCSKAANAGKLTADYDHSFFIKHIEAIKSGKKPKLTPLR